MKTNTHLVFFRISEKKKMQTHTHTIRVWLESEVVCAPPFAVGRGGEGSDFRKG